MRLARNAREAIESLVEGELGLALIDQSMVNADPQHWREAWATLNGRVRLVAIATGPADDEARRFLRETAEVTLSPPYDLRVVRRALVTTLGASL